MSEAEIGKSVDLKRIENAFREILIAVGEGLHLLA